MTRMSGIGLSELKKEMMVMNCGALKRTGGVVWLALVLVPLILASLLMACSSLGMSCDFDSDCKDGDLCVENLCANPCTSDQQCEGVGTCQVFIRQNEADQVNVCMDIADNNSRDEGAGDLQCVDDQECRASLGEEDAICGLNYRCVVPERPPEAGEARQQVNAVLIRDLTSRELVDEQGHPGTVLSAVFVRDESGSIVGYGDTVEFVPGDATEGSGHLDGQPVQLDESGQCVAGVASAMSALGGLGGYYLASFVDSQGVQVLPAPGWKIVVIGWSESCLAEGEAQDEAGEYSVSLCVSSWDQSPDLEVDCQQIGETAAGYAEFLVTTGW